MKKLVWQFALSLSIAALAACSSMSGMMGGGTSVSLTGAEEVPPVSTSATATGKFKIADDGAVSGSVTTTGMQGIMAHIHLAAKGQNGAVIVPLTKDGDTYSVPEGKKLTPEQVQAFKDGKLYVNVHSAAHKGGEIRAQLQP
jgi:hypothetical protein